MTSTAVTLTVSQLARATDTNPDTVRFYEREGLLPAPPRSPAGYRRYGEDAIERLRFVRGAQRLGLRLADIRDLLAIRDTGVCPCEPAEQHLTRRLAEVDAELGRLTALHAEMTRMLDAIPTGTCPPPSPGTWCPPSTDCAEGGVR